MAEPSDSSLAFFTKGSPKQWAYVYQLREAAIRAKADQRSSKKGGPEEFIKLDTWFCTKLPGLIKARKEAHVVYEELVLIAKWRLMMGKYRPKMLDLVRINTETQVNGVTRKAFKKISAQKNLQQAITMLVNLKGIGPSTASAILASHFPEEAPFMSDEGMLSTPGVEATDSTIAEYVNYSDTLRNKTTWLQNADPEFKWTIHMVDQVLWIYYVARDLKPQLLDAMPRGDDEVVSTSQAAAGLQGPSSDAVDDNAQDCTSSNDSNDSESSSSSPVTSNGNFNHSHFVDSQGSTNPNLGGIINHDLLHHLSSNNNNLLNHHHQDSNSESLGSVPYSEEEFSQGGEASCSSSVGGGLVPIGASLNGHYSPVAAVTSTSVTIPSSVTSPAVVESSSSPTTNGGTKRALQELEPISTTTTSSIINSSNNHSLTNGGNHTEDNSSSKDGLLDSAGEDSHDQHQHPQHLSGRLLMMSSPSEENSIDDGVSALVGDVHDLDHDLEPALKKQKTAGVPLELSSALAAATAEAD